MKRQARKLLSLVLAMFIIIAVLPGTATAASDINGHWAEETLDKWIESGWLQGYGDDVYRPNGAVTRAEFMAMMNRVMGYTEKSDSISKYTDVPKDAWYYDTVAIALAAGYINGTSDTTIAPTANITRQEAMTIVARINGVTEGNTAILSAANDGSKVSDWARSTVAACIGEGLIAGSNGNINPTGNLTRAEAVTVLDRVDSGARVYSFAGTYGPSTGDTKVTSITIVGSGITIQNMTVTGDIEITEAAGKGNVSLKGVNVAGQVVVSSNDVTAVNVTGSSINELVVEGSVDKVSVSGSSINEMVIEKGAANVEAVLDAETTVTDLVAEGAGSVVNLEGATVENLTVDAKDVTVALEGATVENLTIEAEKVTVKLDAESKVETLNIDAPGAVIETEKGSTIGTANIDAETTIKGEGTIKVANVNADDVKIETAPEKLNVAEGVAEPEIGTTDIGDGETPGASTPGGSSGGGGGGGGGGGSGSTTTSNITVSYIAEVDMTFVVIKITGRTPTAVTATAPGNVAQSAVQQPNTTNEWRCVFDGDIQREQIALSYTY